MHFPLTLLFFAFAAIVVAAPVESDVQGKHGQSPQLNGMPDKHLPAMPTLVESNPSPPGWPHKLDADAKRGSSNDNPSPPGWGYKRGSSNDNPLPPGWEWKRGSSNDNPSPPGWPHKLDADAKRGSSNDNPSPPGWGWKL
jgi:hypothetical protein